MGAELADNEGHHQPPLGRGAGKQGTVRERNFCMFSSPWKGEPKSSKPMQLVSVWGGTITLFGKEQTGIMIPPLPPYLGWRDYVGNTGTCTRLFVSQGSKDYFIETSIQMTGEKKLFKFYVL